MFRLFVFANKMYVITRNKDKKIPSFFDKSRLENEKQSSQYYNTKIKYQKTKRLFN